MESEFSQQRNGAEIITPGRAHGRCKIRVAARVLASTNDANTAPLESEGGPTPRIRRPPTSLLGASRPLVSCVAAGDRAELRARDEDRRGRVVVVEEQARDVPLREVGEERCAV